MSGADAETEKILASDRRPLRVLLIEDSEDDVLLLLRELRRAGYEPEHEVVCTAGGMERALDRGRWDIILSDHSMPAFSSFAALELLRRRGLSDELPFILVSGKIGEEAAAAAMKAGAHDYVMKDNLTRLGAAIERELRETEVRRERRRAERRYRLMFEQSPLSIQIFSPDGRMLSANRAWRRLWGVEPEQVAGYNVLEDPQLLAGGVMPYIREGFAGRAAVIPPVRYEPDRTIPGVSPVSYRWVRAFIYPVVGEEGEVQEVVLIHEDITETREAWEALREAERRYRSIFENAVEGIFQSTPEGELITANPAMARMLGYASAGELLACVKDITGIYADPGRRDEFRRLVEERGSVSGFELRLRRRDGSEIWVSLAGRAVRDASGKVVGYEGTLGDITGRKRAEEALRQSEELYRSVVEQAQENIMLVDLETRLILQSNPAFRRTLGYTEEELRGMSIYDIVAHDRRSIDWNIERIKSSGRYSPGERRYRRRDGSLAYMEVSVSVISYDGRDAMCVVAHDITGRKRAEEELRESEERYRAVVEQTAEGLFLHDPETRRIVATNRAFRRMFGYTEEELRGMSIYELVDDTPENVELNIRRTLENPDYYYVGERRYRRKDGSVLEVEGSGGVIYYAGRRVICSMVRDITERKRAERAMREIREAERRRISRELHDGVLQDLIYTLQSMQVEQHLSGGGGEERERQIDALRRAVEGLREAIYELRSGEMAERPLIRSVEALVELHRRRTPHREVRLAVSEDFPADLSGPAVAEIARVVQEALANVRRHSEAGLVEIGLHVEGEEAVVEIEDDGRGFDPAASGGGVGLVGMRERAQSLRGRLEVESRPGEGTRVRLRVPLSALSGLPASSRR
ncbi:PAS domain S-box protein [Rubrobacter xylanophilus]|uniref:PAS domain S-box protein n=1 Tax=Rubrobacter xylanophilus TaxID=49319 RepID=UPI001179E83D|nr:PAS domain S-box protein [Rubrobacter xylanophilus]